MWCGWHRCSRQTAALPRWGSGRSLANRTGHHQWQTLAAQLCIPVTNRKEQNKEQTTQKQTNNQRNTKQQLRHNKETKQNNTQQIEKTIKQRGSTKKNKDHTKNKTNGPIQFSGVFSRCSCVNDYDLHTVSDGPQYRNCLILMLVTILIRNFVCEFLMIEMKHQTTAIYNYNEPWQWFIIEIMIHVLVKDQVLPLEYSSGGTHPITKHLW